MKSIVSAAAILALLAPVAASGADLYSGSTKDPLSVLTGSVTFDGAYLSGAAGIAFNNIVQPDSYGALGIQGFYSELRVGYDHRFADNVAGVFVQGSYENATSTTDLYSYGVGGRIGHVFGTSTLVYGLAGFEDQFLSASGKDAKGAFVGTGIEIELTSHVTFGVEGDYVFFDAFSNTSTHENEGRVLARVGYHL